MKKRIGKTLFIVIIIQFLTYSFYGKNAIKYIYFNETRKFVEEKGEIGIYNKNLNNSEKEKIKEILLKKYSKVDFPENKEEYYSEYRLNPKRYGLQYEIEYTFPFKAKIREDTGTLYYVESWKSRFIWCLFTWIKIEQKCVGQS